MKGGLMAARSGVAGPSGEGHMKGNANLGLFLLTDFS